MRDGLRTTCSFRLIVMGEITDWARVVQPAISDLFLGTYKSAQNMAGRVPISDWISALKMVC